MEAGKRKNEFGATMVEYALLVAILSLIGMAGADVLGEKIGNRYGDLAGEVAAAGTGKGGNDG